MNLQLWHENRLIINYTIYFYSNRIEEKIFHQNLFLISMKNEIYFILKTVLFESVIMLKKISFLPTIYSQVFYAFWKFLPIQFQKRFHFCGLDVFALKWRKEATRVSIGLSPWINEKRWTLRRKSCVFIWPQKTQFPDQMLKLH